MPINPMTLLQMIAAGGYGADPRRRKQLPARLAALIRQQTEAGNLEITPGSIRLTPAAIAALEQYCRAHTASGSAPWVLPQHRHYRIPLPRDAIVLPKNE